MKRAKRSSPYSDLVLGGFPLRKLVKFRYVTFASINPSTSSVAYNVYRANSLFDPDYTGVGHQPSNFDRWMGIYNHFTVIGSKINVRWAPTSAGSLTPAIVGVTLNDGVTDLSGLTTEDVLEKKLTRTKWRVVGSQSRDIDSVTHHFSAKKFFGKPNSSIIGDSLYRGTDAGNPTEGAYFTVFASNISGNDPDAMNLIVTIDYIAMLTEPQMTDES